MQIEEIPGRVDAHSVGPIELRCLALIRSLPADASLALDLRNCEFLASLGIRFLVSAAKFATQRSVRLVLLVPPGGPVRETLELAGLANVLPMLDHPPGD